MVQEPVRPRQQSITDKQEGYRAQMRSRLRMPAFLVAAMVVGAAIATGTQSLSPASGADRTDTAVAPPLPDVNRAEALTTARALSGSFAEVVDRVSPAVVFIDIEKRMSGTPAQFEFEGPLGPDMDPFRFFFGPGGRGRMPIPFGNPVQRGQGSGFIISADGYIVTNNHVVGEADRMEVTLADGRRYEAVLVGADPQTEVALIKIDARDLPTVKLGDSNALRVGEWVLAIGSPFGLNHTVTSGIVSARGRGNVGIVDYADFIQTDAAINPGNSGGPLINLDGEVVGMNTAILSPSGASAGIGFAIPINMVKYVVDELRDHGAVTRGYLGISIQQLTPELARYFGLDQSRGILVAEVSPNSPAARAGLKRDDVIVEIDGRPVGESGAFRSHISTTPPGTEVTLTVLRNGKRIEKDVRVGTLPQPERQARRTDGGGSDIEDAGLKGKIGVGVQPLTSELAAQLGLDENESGLLVTQVVPGSPAARAGLRPGAVIKEVNRRPVEDIDSLRQALKEDSRNNTALLLVREREGIRYVAVDLA